MVFIPWSPQQAEMFNQTEMELTDSRGNEVVGTDPTALPDYLDQPQRLAQLVYEFWVSTMETDKVDLVQKIYGDDEGKRIMPSKFADLPQDVRLNFVEAIQVNVTMPLQRMVKDFSNSLSAQVRTSEPTQVAPPPQKYYPCYCCGKNPVWKKGTGCDSCMRRRP